MHKNSTFYESHLSSTKKCLKNNPESRHLFGAFLEWFWPPATLKNSDFHWRVCTDQLFTFFWFWMFFLQIFGLKTAHFDHFALQKGTQTPTEFWVWWEDGLGWHLGDKRVTLGGPGRVLGAKRVPKGWPINLAWHGNGKRVFFLLARASLSMTPSIFQARACVSDKGVIRV